MKLSILCQSPVSNGSTATAAVRETVALAKNAEAWGYHRFWCSEHHSDRALGSASPEILVAAIAAQTSTIRVGSGGVLLPYYAPLKVAEQFNLLEALFPGRIDLGLGRSGGSEGHAPQALRPDLAQRDAWKLVDETLSWLGSGSSKRPFADTFASPAGDSPAPWILGTSPASARFAAERGLPYAFGGFLDPRDLMPSLQTYHQHFKSSRWLDRPYLCLGWYVQCAPTEKEAFEAALSTEHWFVQSILRGENHPFASPAEAARHDYSHPEKMALEFRRSSSLIGTAPQILTGLRSMQKSWMIDEFMLVSIAHDPAVRREGYRLIAQAR